jgi:hypothetical protein
MKLKLTNDELLALYNIIQLTISRYRNPSIGLHIEDKLRLALFEEMLFKVSSKMLLKQSEYSITLKPSWAIAFHIELSGTLELITYEGRAVQKICDQIHQTYS